MKRGVDFALAAFLALALSPVWLAVAAVLLFRNKGVILDRIPRVGRDCKPFHEYAFAMGRGVPRSIPILLNIIKGDMSFVGPRAGSSGEFCAECVPGLSGSATPLAKLVRKRNSVRPGLFCDWWIMQRANVAYGCEAEVDAAYVDRQSVGYDLGVVLRAMPAILGHLLTGGRAEGAVRFPAKVTIVGVQIENITMDDAINRITQFLEGTTPHQVCFVNPHCANVAWREDSYKAVLGRAGLVLADGIGMKIAGKIVGQEIRQNVNGTDMFPLLCEILASSGKSVYLLGAEPGVAEEVRDWLAQHHPRIAVRGLHDGYFRPQDEPGLIRAIADSSADLLLVAMGVPQQDVWIGHNLGALNVKVAMGVGGLFNFYSGRIPRAPLWVRQIGMEWFHRFCQEPRRMWKRYFIGNGLFLLRAVRQRLAQR